MKEHNLDSNDFILDEIESIELIGDRPTIDITVEDTHMFFANDIYTHNSGGTEDVVQAHNIADSYRKIMTADFVLSVSRNTTDKANNTARCHVIKNRFGPDGITLFSKMNTSTGQIELFEASSKDSLEIQSTMQDADNNVKNTLKSKWNSSRHKQNGENSNL
jgi:hypothetical protein